MEKCCKWGKDVAFSIVIVCSVVIGLTAGHVVFATTMTAGVIASTVIGGVAAVSYVTCCVKMVGNNEKQAEVEDVMAQIDEVQLKLKETKGHLESIKKNEEEACSVASRQSQVSPETLKLFKAKGKELRIAEYNQTQLINKNLDEIVVELEALKEKAEALRIIAEDITILPEK